MVKDGKTPKMLEEERRLEEKKNREK